MKLTKLDKEAFVRAVMNDVPRTDYDNQARNLVVTRAVLLLPAAVRVIWNDPELRDFVGCDKHLWMGGTLNSVFLPRVEDVMTDELRKQLDALSEKKRQQSDKIYELKRKVQIAIEACSTLKQAKERLPEFEKYLPADRDSTGVKNLPVISNIVADLSAAGWPNGAVQLSEGV